MRNMVKVLTVVMFMAALGATMPAQASETRADSLLYNQGFEDDTDVFLFPELVTKYRGLYFYTPVRKAFKDDIYGGVIFGNDHNSFAVFVHRPYSLPLSRYRLIGANSASAAGAANILSAWGLNENSASNAYPQGQILDFMWGTGKFGLGFRFGATSASHTDVGMTDKPLKTTTVGFGLDLGFRLSQNAHLGVDATYRYASNQFNAVGINATTRYLSHADKLYTPVYVAGLNFLLYAPNAGSNSWGLMVPFKGGFRLNLLQKKLVVSTLLGLDIQVLKIAPVNTNTQFALVVPTAEIAAEYNVLSWLYLRSSIKGGYAIQFSGGNGSHPSRNQLAFNTGVGFNIHDTFFIDGAISYALWTTGPAIIGGGKPGLFGNVSLSYRF